MRLLVTTSNSVLSVDTSSGAIGRIHAGSGLYYGIASWENKTFVAARNLAAGCDVSSGRGEVIVFGRGFVEEGRIRAPFPLRDMHEIAWHDGGLLVTCSADNMVAQYKDGCWDTWHPLGYSAEAHGRDKNHFNSFLCDDGKMMLLAHNWGPSSIFAFASFGGAPESELPIGRSAHNIRLYAGEILVCSSGEGLVRGSLGLSVKTGGWPRGLVIGEEKIAVGVSPIAKREGRGLGDPEVVVYDCSWNLLATIPLPGEGAICDMALIRH